MKNVYKYLLNCFLLTLPILLWNIAFSSRLPSTYQPDIFWHNIPPVIEYGESIFRMLAFLLMFLMPLRISTTTQKAGLIVYIVGTLLYFAAWIALIFYPQSLFSNSMLGFMAPAYAPSLWLVGIGLVGNSYYFNLRFRRWPYMLIAFSFLAFHNAHTYIVYSRLH